MSQKWVRVRTHWWRRESEQKFGSWESAVFGETVFETQLTVGQLKSPNTAPSERREMMVSIAQIRNMFSGGGVFDGSGLENSQHTIRLT